MERKNVYAAVARDEELADAVRRASARDKRRPSDTRRLALELGLKVLEDRARVASGGTQVDLDALRGKAQP